MKPSYVIKPVKPLTCLCLCIDVSERNQILNDGYHLEPIESPTPISSTEETQTLEDFFVNSSDIDMQGNITVGVYNNNYPSTYVYFYRQNFC
jgi:hypothetical protein